MSYWARRVHDRIVRMNLLRSDPRYIGDLFPTGGPLGAGVEFFMFDIPDGLLNSDAIEAIQDDAYEAAREAIVSGVDAHLASWIRHRGVLLAIEASA